MIDQFPKFARLVHTRIENMSKKDMFVVDIPSDAIWDAYLAAFPDGTNPIYRERTEHDCNCCRSFIRNMGNVVSIKGDKLYSIWPEVAPYPYDVVSKTLRELVENAQIVSLYKTNQIGYGKKVTYCTSDDGPIQWNHFYSGPLNRASVPNPLTEIGQASTNVATLRRAFTELRPEAIDTVLELIDENTLYRGIQYKKQLDDFKLAQAKYTGNDLYLWEKHRNTALLIRNTAIGTLLIDLSNGCDISEAVSAYERITAPENYRRPKGIVTKSMVAKAMETIKELNLEPSLDRRHAALTDIPITETLWKRGQSPVKEKTLESMLMDKASNKPVNFDKLQEIPIDVFLDSVLPNALSIEVMFEPQIVNNLVTLTAPVNNGAPPLFMWDNDISWSYIGNAADAIKRKVKAAGGAIDGIGRVSLSWFNTDDLDAHVIEPNGSRIYHGDKRPHRAKGVLDVDMNVSPTTREPVENVSWVDMNSGQYRIFVQNYTPRENIDIGCVFDIEVGNQRYTITHANTITQVSPRNCCGNLAVDMHILDNAITKLYLSPGFEYGTSAGESWSLKYNQFYPVSVMTTSPNYWQNCAFGNKHWMFILPDCVNPEPTRSLYNEYLRAEHQKHRRAFELIGNTMKIDTAMHQCSGLGFSETQIANCVIRVNGRPYRVKFGA